MTRKQVRLLRALGVDFADSPVTNTNAVPDYLAKVNQSKLLSEGAFGAGMGAINGYLINNLVKNRAYKKHVKYAKKHGLTPLSQDDYFKKNPGVSHSKAALIGAGIGGGVSLLAQNHINKLRDAEYLHKQAKKNNNK